MRSGRLGASAMLLLTLVALPVAQADPVEDAIATTESTLEDARILANETVAWATGDHCVNPHSSPLQPCEPQHGGDILTPIWKACTSDDGSTGRCLRTIRELIPLRWRTY